MNTPSITIRAGNARLNVASGLTVEGVDADMPADGAAILVGTPSGTVRVERSGSHLSAVFLVDPAESRTRRLAVDLGVSEAAAARALAAVDGDVLRAEQWLRIAIKSGFDLGSTT